MGVSPQPWLGVLSMTLSMVAFLVAERIVNSLLTIVCYVTVGPDSLASGTGQFSSLQLLVSAMSAWTKVLASLFNVWTSVVGGLATWAAYTLVVLAMTALVYLSYEQYPLMARGFLLQWNQHIGPSLNVYVVGPLDLLTRASVPFVSLYNTGMWLLKSLSLRGLLRPIMLFPDPIFRALLSLSDVGRTSAFSVQDYTKRVFLGVGCTASSWDLTNLTQAAAPSSGVCLDPQELDLVTPLMHVRDAVAHVTLWVATAVCSQAAIPVDLLVAPLMDLSFAKALQSLVNAVLYTVMQVPVATEARCRLHAAQQGLIMCVPDFAPTFGFLVEGLRRLGQALDNWLNIMALAVQGVVDPSNVPTCAAPSLGILNVTQTVLFGSNHTVLVGLTDTMYAETDGHSVLYFSTASGAGASGATEESPEVAPFVWPIQVDVTLGIAAVVYGAHGESDVPDSSAHGRTTAMLGCRCDDVPLSNGAQQGQVGSTRMRITCAILQYSPDVLEDDSTVTRAARAVFPVDFQVPSTAQYLTCSSAKISVQSVRWPHTRITRVSGGSSTVSRIAKLAGSSWWKEPLALDAAVWVIPACGEREISPVCLQDAVRAACFPYCMAARQSGSYNAPLTLYNQPNWLDRVFLLNRDCSTMAMLQNQGSSLPFTFHGVALGDGSGQLPTGPTTTTTNPQWVGNPTWVTTTPSGDGASSVVSEASYYCVLRPNSMSSVAQTPALLNALLPSSAALDLAQQLQVRQEYTSTLAGGQPFVVAGDTALVANDECYELPPVPEEDSSSSSTTAGAQSRLQELRCSVSVYRIYGGDAQQMFLIPTNRQLPAVRPPRTPRDMSTQILEMAIAQNAVTMPYGFTTLPWTQTPSTATEDAIFYAVNPYWQIYEGFISYCNDNNRTGVMQLMPLSSWSPITIWRVSAYRYCGGPTSTSSCYDNMAAGTSFTDTVAVDASVCNQTLNFLVTGMQYIDPENVAVSVLRSAPRHIHPRTLQPLVPNDGVTRTVTYFLNTNTMQIREGVSWKTEVPQLLMTQGWLCPALRRMPQVGSIMTELAASLVLFVRTPFQLVLNSAYLFARYQSGSLDRCPLASRGHSAVRDGCGVAPFSLKDFFDSAQRVNHLLFRTLGLVAHALEQEQRIGKKAVTFINGIKIAAENLFNPLLSRTPQGSLSEMLALNSVEQLGQAAVSAAQRYRLVPLTAGSLHIADFVYHLVVDVVYNTLQRKAARKMQTEGTSNDPSMFKSLQLTAQDAGGALVEAVYENEQDYYELVTMHLLQACTGLSLALGYTNPYAVVLRHSCNAFALAPSRVYSLANMVLVDIPTAKCMCKDSVGRNFATYVLNECYNDAPESLRPAILATVQQHRSSTEVCKNFVADVSSAMQESLQPFFDELILASDGIAESVDFLLRVGGRAVGENLLETCSNFQTNPLVVAIIPEPVDYFRPCAYTKICRTRCRPELEAFQLAQTAVSGSSPELVRQEFVTTAEMPFFVDNDEGSVAPMTVLATTYLSDCQYACNRPQQQPTAASSSQQQQRQQRPDRCVAIAGVHGEEGQAVLAVMVYCIPTRGGVGVRRNNDATWTVQGSNAWLHEVVDLEIMDTAQGRQVAVLREVPAPSDETNTVWFRHRLDVYGATAALTRQQVVTPAAVQKYWSDAQSIVRIVAAPDQTIFVQVARRQDSTRLCIHYSFQGNRLLDCTRGGFFTSILGGHAVWFPPPAISTVPSTSSWKLAVVPGGGMLASSTGSVRMFELVSTTGSLNLVQEVGFKASLWSLTSGLPASTDELAFSLSSQATVRKLAQVSQVGEYDALTGAIRVLVVNAPSSMQHWLSEVRIEEGAAKTFYSTSVQQAYTTVQQCNTQTCNGCANLHLMRLCYAAQQCTLVRCIGTLTNQNRPLCGIGQFLQSQFLMVVEQFEKAWDITVQTLAAMLGLALGAADEVHIDFLDETFYSIMCPAKDGVATLISVVTATVNALVQKVVQKANSSPMLAANTIDPNFYAMFTLFATSVNTLINQVALFAFYPLMAMQKVYACQVQGFVAIVDSLGMHVTVGNARIQNYTDGSVGKCLSVYYEENHNSPAEDRNQWALQRLVAKQVLKAKYMFLEVLKHNIDAGFAWLIGVVTGIQDVVQSIDVGSCKLPDFYMHDVFNCSCGDTPYSIPQTRAARSPFWCTGTLTMLSRDKQESILVYNPFSFAELQNLLSENDAIVRYLECVSTGRMPEDAPQGRNSGCDSLMPRIYEFERQGVSPIAVLSR
jgi:hypothetical protein